MRPRDRLISTFIVVAPLTKMEDPVGICITFR